MKFKKRKQTSGEYYIGGIGFIILGFVCIFTIIGAIFGIFYIMIGFLCLYKANKLQIKEKAEQQALEAENIEKTRKAIADGIAEGLRKARESELTNVAISTEETNIKNDL
ncbi:MAG: DUF5362 family protein [Methanosarcina vacuolata]|jgi:predicted membrane protein|nr:DUF5362 family protein [Methanosarcina vacuolata]